MTKKRLLDAVGRLARKMARLPSLLWPLILVLATIMLVVIGPSVPRAQAQGGGLSGTTWTGTRGITQTVAQLMARERMTPANIPTTPQSPAKPPLDYASLHAQDNPASPLVGQWPLLSQGALAGPRRLLAPQPVGTTFKAIGLAEAGYIPPDSMGDVGPTQIMAAANGRFKVFDKQGNLGSLNVTSATFWSPLTPTGGVSDPEVRYDRLAARWFALVIDMAPTNNRVLIAVSSGPTITDLSSFTYYAFQIGSAAPADINNFCDYPSLGIDRNAVYTGCNEFSSTGSFVWTSAFVVRKSSLTGGGPIVVTGFSNISSGTSAGPYSPRGVDNDDPQATEGYIIGSDIATLGRIQIRRVSSPGGTPTLSGNITLNVPATSNMNSQPALGSTTNLDASDWRLFQASIHKNKLTGVSSLWTAQEVEVDTSGVATSQRTMRIGARWYEIGNLTTTPALTQSGTLYTATACNNCSNQQRGFIYPSVVETGQGHMVLGSSYASATEYAGAAVAGRLRTDAFGTIQSPTLAQPGLAAYTRVSNNRNRWGDYSFTGVDPNDDMTVWTFQEYADSTASYWAVRAIQVAALPPATPSSLSATAILAGQSSLNLTVTGTSTNGSEFFDPGPDTGGPGYTNHITATLTGAPGVTVNSAAIVIPATPSTTPVTQATLNLNTTNATQGCYSNVFVTITNPDGQSATNSAPFTLRVGPVWMGTGGNSNWSNPSNWAPAAVPIGTQLALFDPACSNTSATVDTNQTVGRVTILSGYTGVITQGSSNWTVNGNLTQQGGTVTGGMGTITVGGVLNLTGGTFTAPSNVLVLNGNFVNSGAFAHNDGTVQFNGTTSISGASTTLFYHATINAGASCTAPGGNLYIAGNWTNNGTFNANSGTVVLNGTAMQTIGGSSSTTFNNLTLNNSVGATLNNSETVDGALVLAAGDLAAGSGTNLLNLACSATVSSAGGGDAMGDVVRTCAFVTGASYAFNNPNTSVKFTAGTAPSSVKINLVKTKPSQFTTAVPRTYTITPTGGVGYTATLSIRYANGAELTGLNEGNLRLWRFDGTRYVSQGGTDQTDVTNPYVWLAGVTQFSPWALADSSPTAVMLSSFQAYAEGQSPAGWVILALVWGIVGAVLVNVAWRKRQARDLNG